MPPSYQEIMAHNRFYYGDRTAITIDECAITFSQLGKLASDVRNFLGQFVCEGEAVAIWLPNSFAWVASLLAARELGAVVVPVNTRLTAREMAYIIEDSGAVAVIAASDFRGRDFVAEAVATLPSGVVVVDASNDSEASAWQAIGNRGAQNRVVPLAAGLMFIQYTSGTTNEPKGVMITEDAFMLTANYCARAQRLSPSSQFMSATPLFHCSGNMHALTTCLIAGSTLHTMSMWDVEKFLHLCSKFRGDVGHGIFMRDVLAYGTEKARRFLGTLDVLAATGSQDDLLMIHDELGIRGVSNLFGMTECCGNLTMWHPDAPLKARISGNGRPQAGNEIRIMGIDSLEPLPAGEAGEIQIRGPTITRGYFNSQDQTAAAFTEDGWLRTGDIGTLTPEFGLSYKTRLKEMIRVGGENVASAEVEQVLREVTDLKELCVVAVSDERLGEVPVLVAVVPEGFDWGSMVPRLRERLAGFKIPRAIYTTASFEKTATNRIQKGRVRRDLAEGKLERIH